MRLVLTILGEAERFGAVPLNGVEVIDLVEKDGLATGRRRASRPSRARRFDVAPRT